MLMVVTMPRRRKKELTALGKILEPRIIEKFGTGTVGLQKAADASGLSMGTLKAWMRGSIEDPRVLSLKGVADALDLSFDDLCRVVAELPPHGELKPTDPEEELVNDRLRAVVAKMRAGRRIAWLEKWEREVAADVRELDLPHPEVPIARLPLS
jgi:transcriptional regulator with XRE-family HTH domain